MAKLQSVSVRESLNQPHEVLDMRVAGATATLLKALHAIDSLVKPKRFELHGAYLRRFEAKDNGFSRHSMRCVGDLPIDEISEWQITGTVGERIVNVIVQGVFHTHQQNRSGNHEFTLNGKPNYRPEYGGITIDDIWQESGLYKNFDKASSLGIIKQNRRGKVIKRYH